MKILIANHRYFVSSGPERYMFNIIGELEKAGHKTMPFSVAYKQNAETPYSKYFVPSLGNPNQVYFEEHRSSVRALPRTLSRLFYSGEVERAVGKMADETQPDIAYVLYYLRKLSPALLVGLKKRKIPIVVRLSDYGMFCAEHHCLRDNLPCTLCLDGSVLHSVRHKCVKDSRPLSVLDAAATAFQRWRRYFDLIDMYVTTNSFMHEMMIKAGYPREKLTCIPTFTDVEKFPPAEGGLGRDYIVSICRLDPPKGLTVLIDAMAHLHRKKTSNIPLLKIAGTGHNPAHVKELKDQVTRLGLQEHVVFTGYLKAADVPFMLQGAMASVIPALWFENLPNTLIESLSCGTPVLASDIGSLTGAITHGIDGFLFRPGDACDLAEKIEHLVTDARLRSQLSENSRRTALKKYSAHAHTAKLMGLFEDLLRTPQ
jgi:glycosyltransferase involved in cell wall biosynthesis